MVVISEIIFKTKVHWKRTVATVKTMSQISALMGSALTNDQEEATRRPVKFKR